MWKVFLEDLIRHGELGYRLYLSRESFDGRFDVVQPPLTLKTHEPNTFIAKEEALLDDSAYPNTNVRGVLQAMADAAWEIGIKPRQLEDSRNELKAMRNHLEDMRQLAGVKK